MMRSLWTGASGMHAQSLKTDTISNNIANVNTTGFKRERLEFQSLLYQTIQNAGSDPSEVGNSPANLQVGHGVRATATTRSHQMGNLEPTHRNVDFAIQGNGFFVIDRGNDQVAYTRDGSFHLTPIGGDQLMLVNGEGFPVLDGSQNRIVFADTIDIQSLVVSQNGSFATRNAAGQPVDLNVSMAIAQFTNRQGLEAIGGNLFVETPASGEPRLEQDGNVAQPSQIIQGHLERSNVQIAEEMVGLIVSQRAFELNSRVIQTADQMLQEATNMRR